MMRIGLLGQGACAREGAAIETAAAAAERWNARRDKVRVDMELSVAAAILRDRPGGAAQGLPVAPDPYPFRPPNATSAPPTTMAATPAQVGKLMVSFSLTDSSIGPILAWCVS